MLLALRSLNVHVGPFWTIRLPASRGRILDVQGRLCAYDELINVAYLDVDYLKKANFDRLKPHLQLLLKNFKINKNTEDILSSKQRFLRLGEGLTRDEIMSLIPTEMLPFVSIEFETRRRRFSDFGMDKILGTVMAGRAFGGVEQALDSTLSGKKDGKIFLRFSGFLTLTPKLEALESPIDGKDVRLTIDLDFQRICYEEIIKAQRQNQALGAGAIVMETKTGKIRAMVTSRNWNDVVLGYFEPGSALKPIVYAIAIESGVLSGRETFNCTGQIKPVPELDVIVRDIDTHGSVDLNRALIYSCNSATIMIAKQIKEKLGEEKYYDWLRKFGFGEKTNVEIAGEIDGVLRKPNKWSKIDFAMISIGQSIGTPPIQFLAAFNTIANFGKFVKPTLIEDSPTLEKRVINEQTVTFIRKALERVVLEGTGKRANVVEVSVAGKTGTAQKLVDGKDKEKYFSIFVGYFPSEDPLYTVLVYLDEPSSGTYLAGEVAAPIFASIVKRILKIRKEHPLSVPTSAMPDLRGLTIRDALLILNQLGVKNIEVEGTGRVKEQYPEPGSIDFKEKTIILKLQ
ncbi:penicillin-binding protein [Pseudothermotoga sp.]|uniref:penicillin-binding protein n=1 Tax=Pseudothermotoga sp. TaxID=2033661 RepID=UPI0031F63565